MKIDWTSWKLWGAVAFIALGITIINSRNYYVVRVKVALGIADMYIPIHPIMRVKAELGSPEAQYDFGRTYLEHGYSNVEAQQVWSDAMVWFRKAAERGYAPAEFRVGRCYQLGHCGAKDEVEAATWYQKSAEHGYLWAQSSLASDYYSGLGVKQDYEEAHFWAQLAADTRAKIGISIYGGFRAPPSVSKLTSEQKEAVKKKVAEWEKAHPAPTRADQPDPNP